MPFQPGNTEGTKSQKPKPFKDALRMEAAALENGEQVAHPKGSLRWNAQLLLLSGDVPSIKEIADRLDGKPAQEVTGKDGGAIEHNVGLAWMTQEEAQRRGWA